MHALVGFIHFHIISWIDEVIIIQYAVYVWIAQPYVGLLVQNHSCTHDHSFDLFCTQMQRITHWTIIKSCFSTNMKQNTNLRISFYSIWMKCHITSEHKCDECSTSMKFCWKCGFSRVMYADDVKMAIVITSSQDKFIMQESINK